jgi:hypothetical protein
VSVIRAKPGPERTAGLILIASGAKKCPGRSIFWFIGRSILRCNGRLVSSRTKTVKQRPPAHAV